MNPTLIARKYEQNGSKGSTVLTIAISDESVQALKAQQVVLDEELEKVIRAEFEAYLQRFIVRALEANG